jgi:hypothetical protein
MNTTIFRSTLAGLVMCGVLMASIQAPARADGAASTRTIIGAVAAIAAIATAINVSEKNQAANTIEGYLPDGSAVYEDGHVVTPNGYSWYPGNQGEQIACNGQSCSLYASGRYNNSSQYNSGNGYYNNNGNGYYNNNGNGYYNNNGNGNGYYNNNGNGYGYYNNNGNGYNNNNGGYGGPPQR